MQYPILDEPHITPQSGCPFRGIGNDPTTHTLYPHESGSCFKHDLRMEIELDHQSHFCLTSAHTMCPYFRGQAEPPPPPSESVLKTRIIALGLVVLIGFLCLAVWLAFYPPISVAADRDKADDNVQPPAVVEAAIMPIEPSPELAAVIVAATPTKNFIATEAVEPTPAATIIPATPTTISKSAEAETMPVPVVVAPATPVLSKSDSLTASTSIVATPTSILQPKVTPTVAEISAESFVPGLPLTLNIAANLRIGSGPNYEVRKVLPAGTSVWALSRSDNYWFYVQIEDGTHGWLAYSVVAEAISPELRALPIFYNN